MAPHSTVLRARWLLPIDRAPIENGWIEIAAGDIVATGRGTPPGPADDLGDVAILPGLVNAHTHLELSHLAGQVRPAGSLVEWIRQLLSARAASAHAPEAAMDAMRLAAARMHDTGTVLVGDVSNTLATPPVFREAGLDAVVFHELLGFNVVDAGTVVRDAWQRADEAAAAVRPAEADPVINVGVVGHAPYSVAPALLTEIARRARHAPLALHVAESADEIEFLRTGRGPFRDLLETLGVWHEGWRAPQCDPIEYLARLEYLRPRLLAVHAVHLRDDALERLRDAAGVVVTCPRSNAWVGAGPPRLSHFYAAGVPVAIGTDSLASVESLNLFDEIAEMRRLAPEVTAASLLESATRVGAEALGFGHTHGTLARGKRAALISVDIPGDTGDVEEYLVGGVPPSAIHRLIR